MRRVVEQIVPTIEHTRKALFNFNPAEVLTHFKNYGQVSVAICDALHVNTHNGELWNQFCRAALSGARFLARFNNHEKFYRWVNQFDGNDFIRPVLPMFLSYELDGFGFPLACDFLKRIGYTNFCKPDRHLNAIFSQLELCEMGKNKEYKVFKAVVRMARNVQQTPYTVDRMFWFIGSGYFYLDFTRPVQGWRRHRQEFIDHVRAILIQQNLVFFRKDKK